MSGTRRTAATIYSLPLHDALPIYPPGPADRDPGTAAESRRPAAGLPLCRPVQVCERAGLLHAPDARAARSEEHTSELQSRLHLVCRLLLDKEKRRRRGGVARLVCF